MSKGGLMTLLWVFVVTAASAATPDSGGPPSHAPEIGAVSRSTGHIFRERLSSGITADRGAQEIKASEITNDKGLIDQSESRALPSDLWKGTTAKNLAHELKFLAPNPNIPVMLELARRLLLTDATWPEGDDLRALRLEKMMSFGAGEEAAKLYTFWTPETPSLPLLQAGTMALLRAGRPSVACLDITIHQDVWALQEKTLSYFPAMMEACKTWMTKGGLSLPHLFGPYDLRKDLTTGLAPESHILSQADSLYAQARNGAIDEAFLIRFADLSKKIPFQTLVPFAPLFEKISPDISPSIKESIAVSRVLFLSGSSKSSRWIQKVKAQLPNGETPHLEAGALILLGKMAGAQDLDGPIPIKFASLKEEKKPHITKILKILSELLDKRPDFIDTPGVVYEKKTDLTNASRYVMHWRELQNNLKTAQKNGHVGRLILISLLITQTGKPGDLPPDALALILKGMYAAGLKQEACQFAATVLLGVIQTGE